MQRRCFNLQVPAPSLYAEATKSLTIVVPAYNEARRIAPMLQETMAYLQVRINRKTYLPFLPHPLCLHMTQWLASEKEQRITADRLNYISPEAASMFATCCHLVEVLSDHLQF
jgi:hypothetical protein